MEETTAQVDVPNAAGAKPETKPVNVRLQCPTHGDITQSTMVIALEDLSGNAPVDENGKKRPIQFLYCLHCLNDMLLGLQKEGRLPKVDAIPVEVPTTKEEETSSASPAQ